MTTFKSLRCIWALLFILQHVLCFDLTSYCRKRCLIGLGGVACRCSAMHFSGKRSYAPKKAYLGPELTTDSRRNFLLSILNRPEVVKALNAYSPNEHEGKTMSLGSSSGSQFQDGHVQSVSQTGAGGPGGNIGEMDSENSDDAKMVLSQQPHVIVSRRNKAFAKLENQRWKPPHYRYPGLTSELAQLVKYTWQHMPSQKVLKYNQESSSSGLEDDNDDDGDVALSDNEKSEEDVEVSEYRPATFSAKASFVKAVKDLIDRLPKLLQRYESTLDTNIDADDSEDDVLTPTNQKGDKMEAWHRLMKYLAHNIAARERHTSLQRTKRDESANYSKTETVESD